jgi:tRNA(Ile)-lysidine synthase
MTLVARVRRTIVERALIPVGGQVVCACSGGPDSAALLACLARLAPELRFGVIAASVDHGLRAEAAEDVRIAAAQAERMGVTFHALRIRVAAGPSLQARARDQRYAALTELARALGASRIAVGHTQDDQAETVLARVLRGAGVTGLGAIRPLRADGVVRPLIDCRRTDAHLFARACFDCVASDRSNHDQRFGRVRIRSHVVPSLEAEDPALIRHLAQLADDARDCMQVVDQLADQLFRQAAPDTETLEFSAIAAQPAALRKAVLRRFVERGAGVSVGRAELTQLDRITLRGRGEVWLTAGYSVLAAGVGRLRLQERSRESGQDS